MKIRIMDLMDYYDGPIHVPTAVSTRGSSPSSPQHLNGKKHRKTLLFAAALLLLAAAGIFALFFSLQQSARGRTAFEETPVQSSFGMEDFPDSTLESPSLILEPSSVEDTYSKESYSRVFDTTIEYSNYGSCYGNLIYLDEVYYTMTDEGPEPVELQTLNTTVELYGTWEVSIDYTIIDGELVFHNNTSTTAYTMIDGEQVTWTEYEERYGEPADLTDGTWITPKVTVATPVAGSADTVQLTISRTDQAKVDNCHYPFFYNIVTGEVSDPLANVPDLFDYGTVTSVSFNDSQTRAIVHVLTVGETFDGSSYVSGSEMYVCDLVTGEMVNIDSLFSPFYSEADPEGYGVRSPNTGYWGADDSLLCWASESVLTEDDPETTANTEWISWLFSYDFSTGQLNYSLEGIDSDSILHDGNQTYIQYFVYNGNYPFQIIDSANGKVYRLNASFTSISGARGDSHDACSILCGDNGIIYFVDAARASWINLGDYLVLPADPIETVWMVTEDWFCLSTGKHVYCYHVPEDVEWTPLEQYAP